MGGHPRETAHEPCIRGQQGDEQVQEHQAHHEAVDPNDLASRLGLELGWGYEGRIRGGA